MKNKTKLFLVYNLKMLVLEIKHNVVTLIAVSVRTGESLTIGGDAKERCMI